ncbi:K(+) efflux antiporter 2, chloroplastic isoform X2 [Physcomitrium patens]|uniref:RCK N-terminal domain-containing protein n=1 Tax=Physcomitrium patens TaxID=3218 RepID=A0A7I4E6H2_PHYPA|nr:K(+) efflux antiporter 2, chloroplastic-like isoform X2 [Physcomitrium patens]|eukprot:XP_024380474.1 K(+) efflux antiporter 2, chloroplastic-like isoform X2 [Physcomitrella patens]
MICPRMLDRRSLLPRFSSLQSPVLPSLASKKEIAGLSSNVVTPCWSLRKSHSPLVCDAIGVCSTGQSRLAAVGKQKRVQCGGNKNGRRRVVVQCETDGGQGLEDVSGKSRTSDGDSNSSPIASDVADAGQSPAEDQDMCNMERESPAAILKELLRLAQEDLEMARRNSERLAEKALKVAEKAMTLQEEAVEAERAANDAKAEVENILQRESDGEVALASSRAAYEAAQKRVERAEMALKTAQSIARSGETSADAVQVSLQRSFGTEEGKLEGNLDIATEDKVDVEVRDVNAEAALETVEVQEKGITSNDQIDATILQCEKEIEAAFAALKEKEAEYSKCEEELSQTQFLKMEILEKAALLSETFENARIAAAAADSEVAIAMSLAEESVAMEVEATQRVSDGEIALQKAEGSKKDAVQAASALAAVDIAEKLSLQVAKTAEVLLLETELKQEDDGKQDRIEAEVEEKLEDILVLHGRASFSSSLNVVESTTPSEKQAKQSDGDLGTRNEVEPPREAEKAKKPEPKSSTKKSSRFFPASYFSTDDEGEFTPSTVFSEFATAARAHLGKVGVAAALLLAGGAYLNNRMEKRALLLETPPSTTSIEVQQKGRPLIKEIKKIPKRVKKLIEKLPRQELNEEETSLFDVLWLLLASVVFVPLVQKIPGGSPVLGYLAAGVLIGPYALSIIQNVHGTKAIGEFGVVFLLFNIGLELSVERLSSMKKYVFGFGSAQVLATAVAVGYFTFLVSGASGPAAIVIGNGLALSSTAVVLQVLQERGESTSRHGRATFSVLLFQDLAVVVLLILIPLLSPNSSKGGVGFQAIAEALGLAAVKAVAAITVIIAGGRLLLRPVYKRMADNHNAEIFAANTLLVVLGTSFLTARAGLSMALGAFLAGLLLAETEFALQVESDIAPYRGLLLGLFFMTVGMSIDPKLLVAKFPMIMGALTLLIVGKTLIVTGLGRCFGLSTVAAVRAGLFLAPGGEFAFVAFGEAVNQGIMSAEMSSLLFLVTGLSMAITPWLAAGGQLVASRFDQQDVRSLLPVESETDDLQNHMIICGFGRVGQIIAQLLAERLIPFVALDVRSERVSMGRALDLPVFFGDAGSREILHKVGAERASAAVIALDTPGANYRTVWALSKYYPHVKTFVRAHDVDHGMSLEKAGATAVVPETLEPSLQLAAAILAQAKLPASEIAAAIDQFRTNHLSELTELSEASGSSLGYGTTRSKTKPKLIPTELLSKEVDDGNYSAPPGIVAVP